MITEWNPRYVQFCRAMGFLDPERCDLPGYAFINWHNKRLEEARHQQPGFFHHGLYGTPVYCDHCQANIKAGGLLDHNGYDAWLVQRVDQLLKGKVALDS
jgi:hypothetical protein